MAIDFKNKFETLAEDKILVIARESNAALKIKTSSGATICGLFWRLIIPDGNNLSNFDDKKVYSLPEPIDAIKELSAQLTGHTIRQGIFNIDTGDLEIRFDNKIILQIFNFTGLEVWEVEFADNTGEFSNFALTRK